MNKLIIGALILGSMLTISGCASKSADVASNNVQTEQTEQIQPQNNSLNSNINDKANNNTTTDNKTQNNKSDKIKTNDSQNNKPKSDKYKSNDTKNTIEKEQTKNDYNDKESQNDSSINKKNKTNYHNAEDTISDNSSVKKETKIKNNNENKDNLQNDNSSKKDYNNSSKNTDSTNTVLVKSNSTTSSSNINKKSTVKPTKKEVEIAKKTNTPSKNNVVKNRVTQNNKVSSVDQMQDYYGTWVINEVIGYTRISTNSTSPLNKTLVLNKNSYTNNSFGFTIENPKYLITNISKSSFCNGYKLNSLQGTGLTGDTITALDINSSTNPNSDFDELYIQNGSLIYLQDGVFFRCVKQ